MNDMDNKTSIDKKHLFEIVNDAAKQVAPLWPLENFVAVNPFMGMSDKSFNRVAHELSITADIQMTLPTAFYLQKIDEGAITETDLAAILDRKQHHNYSDVDDFMHALKNYKYEDARSFQLVVDLASELTGKDWDRYVKHRITTWATSYFDKGQASWQASFTGEKLFHAWKKEAEIDRTSDISGIRGFRRLLKAMPDDHLLAIEYACETLGINQKVLPIYLQSLLLRNGGWAAFIAKIDWDAKLKGEESNVLTQFVAILLTMELGLFSCIKNHELMNRWDSNMRNLSDIEFDNMTNGQLVNNLILQEAFDHAKQRELIDKLNTASPTKENKVKVKAQAIFCIDVRSEVFRRNLEHVDNTIETLGFAGFFGFPVKHVPIGQKEGDDHCPALITTSHTIEEYIPDSDLNKRAFNSSKLFTQFQQLVKTFKSGAITCFSFVSPLGLSFLPKLFTDSFGLTSPVKKPSSQFGDKIESKKAVNLSTISGAEITTGIPLEDRVKLAKNALKAMSLTSGFGEFVLIVGHAADMVNNPHASGYDCGACGGRSGAPNAKVAAKVLNDVKVREALNVDGINIPAETVFMACLHNTTTDEIKVYHEDELDADKLNAFQSVKESLAKAGHLTRAERLLRFQSEGDDVNKEIFKRTKDWSQVRPEWGLAGCSSFVVASRERTKAVNLDGKTFLHSYNWQQDENFAVLESIMTAPMVVTNWINLQYFASTVDNLHFGSGNKTLHNVSAGVGVLEGYSGDLRVGLPWQAVHDGEKYQHEPVRLKVVIEAPIEAMNEVLAKHDNVKQLCDNGWLQLLAMNEEGKVYKAYSTNLKWNLIDQ